MARQEKQNNERGIGIKPEERTESQQQKCVSASATVGAFLRYICRRDERNKGRRARYVTVPEMTDEQLEKHVAASTRSLPIARIQRSRPLPPPGTAKSTAGAYPLIN